MLENPRPMLQALAEVFVNPLRERALQLNHLTTPNVAEDEDHRLLAEVGA